MQLQQNFPRQTPVSTTAELFLLVWIDYDQIMMGWDWIVEVRRGVCRGLWEMRRREDIPVLFLSPPPVAAGHWPTEHTISQHNLHSTARLFSSPIFSPLLYVGLQTFTENANSTTHWGLRWEWEFSLYWNPSLFYILVIPKLIIALN